MTNRLITQALPYANGSLHLGHLDESILSDIHVRHLKQKDLSTGGRTVYVCADDQHGSAITLRAQKEGIPPEALIERLRAEHIQDFEDFGIGFDHYHATHSEENRHLSCLIYGRLKEAGLIYKAPVEQLFDEEAGIFLADRFVKGSCPQCQAADQHGDNCEKCGSSSSALDELNHLVIVGNQTHRRHQGAGDAGSCFSLIGPVLLGDFPHGFVDEFLFKGAGPAALAFGDGIGAAAGQEGPQGDVVVVCFFCAHTNRLSVSVSFTGPSQMASPALASSACRETPSPSCGSRAVAAHQAFAGPTSPASHLGIPCHAPKSKSQSPAHLCPRESQQPPRSARGAANASSAFALVASHAIFRLSFSYHNSDSYFVWRCQCVPPFIAIANRKKDRAAEEARLHQDEKSSNFNRLGEAAPSRLSCKHRGAKGPLRAMGTLYKGLEPSQYGSAEGRSHEI